MLGNVDAFPLEADVDKFAKEHDQYVGIDLLKKHYKNLGVNKINTDSYYKDHFDLSFKERSKINFDHPDSIDFELLINDLNSLEILKLNI